MHGRCVRPRVGHRDRHQQVVGRGLGVAHLDDPVPPVAEHPGVQQLILRLQPAPRRVHRDQLLIRERGLRVVVAPPVPGVAGDRVQVPPALLDVLAVVALRAGQPEGPLLQDRVAAVPQRQGQAQPLLDVAEPGQAVLAPPVGPGPGVIVRQVVPRIPVGAVVLPHRAPLPLADVRPPPVPVAGLPQPVLELPESRHPVPLGAHGRPSASSPRRNLCSRRSPLFFIRTDRGTTARPPGITPGIGLNLREHSTRTSGWAPWLMTTRQTASRPGTGPR